jgi:hypothetical protein
MIKEKHLLDPVKVLDAPLGGFELCVADGICKLSNYEMVSKCQVKLSHPDVRILYYKNIVIDWGGSAASQELETIEGTYLQSVDGSYPTINARNSSNFFDIGLPEVRVWWMKDAQRLLNDPSIDGILIDANIKVLVEGYFLRSKKVSKEKYE